MFMDQLYLNKNHSEQQLMSQYVKGFSAVLGYVKYWIVKDNMLYCLWKQYDSFILPYVKLKTSFDYFKNIFIY